ncbi:MAG TPA: hypothetical protein VEC96_01675, partial [Anaerolineae bacterium]|nr:hypothetical protein [Anaerolineae bacterium]
METSRPSGIGDASAKKPAATNSLVNVKPIPRTSQVSRLTHHFSPLLPTTYYLLPISFLLLFYFYPLFSIFGLSFAPEGRLDLAALQELITTTYYAKTLWFTIWQAVLSTLLTLALALPGAYVFARYRF